MLISFEKSFLFVHIPKTGGTSIRMALSAYQHENEHWWTNRLLQRCGISINYCLGDYRHLRFRTHDPIMAVQRHFPPDTFCSLFKFAFVRNPWDLLVSAYKYIQTVPSHKRHRLVTNQRFDDFIEFAIAKDIGQQLRMIADPNGQLLVDFVGRFENLRGDFAMIAKRIHVEAELPHVNETRQTTPYQEYYSQRSKDRVQFAYQDDIETFGYEFDPTDRIAVSAAA